MVNLPTFFLGAICALSLTSELQASVLNGNDDPETSTDSTNKFIVMALAQRRQFPYIVSIAHLLDDHICRGSILTPLWIVTNAWCAFIVHYSFPDSQVVAGALYLYEIHEDIQRIDIEQSVWLPLNVSDAGLVNDIGLIKLASPLKFNEAVQPIRIPRQDQNFQGAAVTAGWGIYARPYPYPENFPNALKYIRNKIISNEECQDELPKNPSIHDSMICTAPLIGFKTSCHGDFGAPLVQNNALVGIVARGVSCTPYLQDAPTIYTRVNWHLDFIRHYVPDV